jgi:hypothetical protein
LGSFTELRGSCPCSLFGSGWGGEGAPRAVRRAAAHMVAGSLVRAGRVRPGRFIVCRGAKISEGGGSKMNSTRRCETVGGGGCPATGRRSWQGAAARREQEGTAGAAGAAAGSCRRHVGLQRRCFEARGEPGGGKTGGGENRRQGWRRSVSSGQRRKKNCGWTDL